MSAQRLLAEFERLAEGPAAIPKLRQFIHDLAVRGKLVSQDPNDAPPGVDNSLSGRDGESDTVSLPSGWSKCRFGDILQLEYGKALPKAERAGAGNVAVYGSNGIVGKHTEALTHEPAIIIGRKGSAGALSLSLGASWTTDVAYFLVPPPCYDLRFLLIVLKTLRLDSLSRGIKPGLNRSEAYDLPVVVPPLPEQQRIVAKVDELMVMCDELEAAQIAREARRDRLRITSLTTLAATHCATPKQSARLFLKNSPRMITKPEHVAGVRQTILGLAVRGRLVAQNAGDEPVDPAPIRATTGVQPIATDELPFTAPRSWEWRRLGSAADLINGDRSKVYPKKHEYVPRGVAWINTGHIEPDGTLSKTRMNYITRAKFESLRSGKVKPDDLVYCLRGATLGKTAIVDWLDEGAVASSLVIVRLDQTIAFPSFIRHYLVSPTGQQLIQRFDNGSAQPNLAANSVKQFVTPIPPLAEQRRIVAKVDQLMAVCDELERSLARAQIGGTRLLEAVLAQAIAHAGAEPERVLVKAN